MRVARILATAVAGVLAVASCGSGSQDGSGLATDLASAARSVAGVSAADLSYKSSGSGDAYINGTVTLETADTSEGTQVLDNVYAAMTPVLADHKATTLFFVTKTSSGATVDPTSLDLDQTPTGFALARKYGG